MQFHLNVTPFFRINSIKTSFYFILHSIELTLIKNEGLLEIIVVFNCFFFIQKKSINFCILNQCEFTKKLCVRNSLKFSNQNVSFMQPYLNLTPVFRKKMITTLFFYFYCSNRRAQFDDNCLRKKNVAFNGFLAILILNKFFFAASSLPIIMLVFICFS